MNLLSFMLVLAGVLPNAAAQVLLKARTNGIGPLIVGVFPVTHS
jgi:hypothetical protein